MKPTIETIMKEKEKKEILTFPYPYNLNSDGSNISFTIIGQMVERSFEDRSVFLSVKTTNKIETDFPIDFDMWLQAEDAIEIGLLLISNAKFAMKANMLNHQLIHMGRKLKDFIQEGRVEKIIFRMIEENPCNYGGGFHTFLIKPVFIKTKEPKYMEDFSFEDVINWSPFPKDFHEQIETFTKGVDYSFENYNHEEEVEKFNNRNRL